MKTMKDYVITLEGAYQRYPDKQGKLRTILNDINLKIAPGEFVTLVGPTGCGKSTLLRLILGSELPAAGQVLIGSMAVKGPNRDRGIVFQRYALYENLTVRHNVMLGLELEEFGLVEPLFRPLSSRMKRMEFKKKADEYLKRVGLLDHADKYPFQLSGGQKQRAAIAQAMVMNPEVLLMDEPFGALDIGTREDMQVFVLEQWQRERQVVIFVTHDLEEALFLGTRLLVVSQYYSNNDGAAGEGATIVKDISIPWSHPRPTEVKHTKEFNELMASVRHEGLNPKHRQRIEQFDLSHQDAAWWKTKPGWEKQKGN